MKEAKLRAQLYSESVDDEASDRAFLFFSDDHAIGLVFEEECAGVPGALVFGALLLQHLRPLVVEVDEDVAVVFDAAKYVLDAELLVVRDADQVDTPLARASDLSQDLTLQFQ